MSKVILNLCKKCNIIFNQNINLTKHNKKKCIISSIVKITEEIITEIITEIKEITEIEEIKKIKENNILLIDILKNYLNILHYYKSLIDNKFLFNISMKINNYINKYNYNIINTIVEYPNKEKLINLCKSFEQQEISLTATFMGNSITIYNCNAIGDILEDIFYPILKYELNDFEEGPKQESPDYYGINKTIEFEQKVFMSTPSFDIGNFTSYINKLCEDDGIYKKIFKTKYLVFEYAIKNEKITIITFHYLSVYNLVGYSGKYPISMQVKKNMWYNIRPDNVKNWYLTTKTPQLFIDNIIKCIIQCPHIEEKNKKIISITEQFNKLKLIYTF